MNWFKGNIEQAVNLSKAKNAIFVVFVEGNDELSLKLRGFIDTEKIRRKLESDKFVALKIDSGSQSYMHFAEIYQLVPLPSIFFIGKTGVPIEVVTGIISSSDELDAKINSVLKTIGVELEEQEESLNTTNASANLISNEQQSVSTDNTEVVCENGVCFRRPVKTTDESSTDTNAEKLEDKTQTQTPVESIKNEPKKENSSTTIVESQTVEDSAAKLEKAKQLLENKRKEKEAEEIRLEREKEIQRRKQSKDAQSLKSWQKEQELKDLKENIRRERKEEQEARQRILQKIASDRAERAQKFPPQASTSVQQQAVPTVPSPSNTDKHHTSRIQFKKPSGESDTHTFNSSDEFKTVRDYVKNTILADVKTFSLVTTFPRREFAATDDDKTLLELGLCPTAVILIITASTSSTSPAAIVARSGGFINIFNTVFWSVVSPIFAVLGYLRNFITGRKPPTENSGARKRANEDAPLPNDAAKHRNLDRFMNNEVVNDRPSTSGFGNTDNTNVPYRRVGNSNVHRLRDNNDDDDNNTWNGNSTQQQ